MRQLLGFRKPTHDKVYTGFIAGTIGGLATFLVDMFFYAVGVTRTMILEQAGYLVLPNGISLDLPSSLMMGAAVHWVVAAVLGVTGAYIIRLTGRDFLWLKGVLYGGFIWVGLHGYLAATAIPDRLLKPDVATSVLTAFSHLLFGLITLLVAGLDRVEAS
jgi:hypothetical protein